MAAAYCAGALSLDSAMWLAYQRSVNVSKFGKSPLGDFEPKMIAVSLSASGVEDMLKKIDLDEAVHGRVCIAGINSLSSTTLSGDGAALDAI